MDHVTYDAVGELHDSAPDNDLAHWVVFDLIVYLAYNCEQRKHLRESRVQGSGFRVQGLEDLKFRV
jgi:hypothetical protein